jgi:predicted deacylase
VGKDTATVAAQEIISSASAYRWMDSLSGLPFIQMQVIGYSILGKPVVALRTTGSSGKGIIVVLSRQHPPEVTGYMAMQEFVHTLTADTELARDFRGKYELVVIPMVNPDGVDEGTWRHNAAGVDLNRDWNDFKQPETRAVKDYLFKAVLAQGAKVYFGIDFHSTWHDVFYTNKDTATNLPGFMGQWLSGFEKAVPGFKANIRPSGSEGAVSKSWMLRALGADALTYEVGDDTSREMLRLKGRVAAETLMKLLLRKESQ